LHLLAGNTIECPCLILDVGIEVRPKLNKEESILWAFIIEFLQPTLLLREFVIDLPHVYSLYIKNQVVINTLTPANYYIYTISLIGE